MADALPAHGHGGALAGVEAWLCRAPDRAAAAADALQSAGARVRLVPLIGFRPLPDPAPLAAAVRQLADGGYDWLVLTSVTTILALERTGPVRRDGLAGVVGGTRVAAVGEGTRAALAERGVRVDFLPAPQSAAGLAAQWPDDGASVLLPQSAIAPPRLAENLGARGCTVDAVPAYETVDWPAGPDALLETGTGAPAAALPLDTPEQLAARPPGPAARAVVLTSPSTVRRFLARCRPLPADLLLAAIGASTAQELAGLGSPAHAVAAEPTPAGIVEALMTAISAERSAGPDGPAPRFPDTGRQNPLS